MSGTSLNALLFIISIVFDLYLIVLIIRFFLALSGAEYSHPITQFVVKFTSFIVKPMRKIIPDFRGVEFATLVLILLVEMIKFFIITILSFGLPNLLGLILLAFADAVKLTLEVLSFVFLLQLFIYWLISLNQLVTQFTSPFMRPLQRMLAPNGGTGYMWVAWVSAFVVLQLFIVMLVNPLLAQGLKVAVA